MISDISSHPIHHELFDKFLYPEAKRGDRKSKVLLIFSFFEYHAFVKIITTVERLKICMYTGVLRI